MFLCLVTKVDVDNFCMKNMKTRVYTQANFALQAWQFCGHHSSSITYMALSSIILQLTNVWCVELQADSFDWNGLD